MSWLRMYSHVSWCTMVSMSQCFEWVSMSGGLGGFLSHGLGLVSMFLG